MLPLPTSSRRTSEISNRATILPRPASRAPTASYMRSRCAFSPSRCAASPQGNVIKVSYKGTESEYTVDPTTPIFANATGDRSLFVPGAAVFVIASKHDDGKLTSTRLYVEKDGTKPPM